MFSNFNQYPFIDSQGNRMLLLCQHARHNISLQLCQHMHESGLRLGEGNTLKFTVPMRFLVYHINY